MTRKIIAIALGSMLAVALLAAPVLTDPAGPLFSRYRGENVASIYFATIANRDFDRALSLYTPEFFERTPRDQWLRVLETNDTKLGRLKSFELLGWSTRANLTAPVPTITSVLKYRVTYSENVTVETLTVSWPFLGGEARIHGHQIQVMN